MESSASTFALRAVAVHPGAHGVHRQHQAEAKAATQHLDVTGKHHPSTAMEWRFHRISWDLMEFGWDLDGISQDLDGISQEFGWDFTMSPGASSRAEAFRVNTGNFANSVGFF